MSRLSPPSLGRQYKIKAGTIAFGNDKNLWIRKQRNDSNTYWTILSYVSEFFKIGLTRNQKWYDYVELFYELPNDEEFIVTYLNDGTILFEYNSDNGEKLLELYVPLSPNAPIGVTNERIRTFREIVIDFIEYKLNEDDKYLDLFSKIKSEINVFFNILANQSEISEAWTEKSGFDYQAQITSKKFKADRDALSILNIFEDEEEKPQPTPQPETPEAKKGLPSIDPQTWNGEFKVGDKVKVRWDFSNDLGLKKTKGFSKVEYFSSENNFSVVNVNISSDSMRPENPSGKLYELNTGGFWEGKDLELITEQEQPTPTPQPDEFKPIWRVKTEQEFIDEFGDDWRFDTAWLKGANNMDYLFGQPVTNSNFDAENLPPTRFDTAEELGIDKGGDNVWILNSTMFTKIDYDAQESSPMIGKLFLKQNYDTYLQISENEDRLVLESDDFFYIRPAKFTNDNKHFLFLSTNNSLELYDTTLKIRLNYELGIDIEFGIPFKDISYNLQNITNESVFGNAIAYVRKFLRSGQFEQELNAIASLLTNGIWRERSIVCEFMSSIPYPKFAVGDKVKKVIGGTKIFTIKTITTFDDKLQQWDYDVVDIKSGGETSYWENELELVSQDSEEKPLPSDCKVDENMIDSLVVGAFFQKNKSRINALNSEISCIIKEALLSLSNYEKCGDGAEIPMPQPTQEKKLDLLAEIRDLNKDL